MKFNEILDRALIIVETALTDEQWIKKLKKSNARIKKNGEQTRLKLLPDEDLQEIVDRIRSIVPAEQKKFAPYYLYQVAKGHLQPDRIAEDQYRISNTISKFIKLSRKKAWEGSKNLYDYDDWRQLEQTVKDNDTADYKNESKSNVIYTKKYVDNNAAIAAQLLGKPLDEVPYVQYWIRKILTAEDAYKYGRGTTWCTATDPKKCDKHPFNVYGLLYIIEKKTNDTSRRPILQVSNQQVMNKTDQPIGRVGKALASFIRDALPSLKSHQIMPGPESEIEIQYSGVKILLSDVDERSIITLMRLSQ